MGEGFSGTSIKDTWKKKGGVCRNRRGSGNGWNGVEGSGKKAEKCI